VDIVGPGAGVFEPHWSNFWIPPGSKESEDTKHGDRYKMMDINVTHPIRAAQMAISTFLHPKDGKKCSPENPKRIIMTASIAGQVSMMPVPMYIASKWAISGFTRSLGSLERTIGIRCNAVAPGLVRTPLFLDHPEKLKIMDETKDKWVTPESVAEAMVKLMEDDELVGGTILEVGANSQRIVPLFNNPGPKGEGFSTSNSSLMVEEVYEWLGTEDWGKF
jgi:NAD(P)-dependent dehydrogenase (short-subunit alcohol dehydrogenase family)